MDHHDNRKLRIGIYFRLEYIHGQRNAFAIHVSIVQLFFHIFIRGFIRRKCVHFTDHITLEPLQNNANSFFAKNIQEGLLWSHMITPSLYAFNNFPSIRRKGVYLINDIVALWKILVNVRQWGNNKKALLPLMQTGSPLSIRGFCLLSTKENSIKIWRS